MKKIMIILLVLLLLIGCKNEVPKEYLVGGTWVATAGYEDREVQGEPQCPKIISVDFDENDIAKIKHNEDVEFEYTLDEDGMITFWSEPIMFRMRFNTNVIDDNGMVIEGVGDFEDQICYMERQTE